MALFAKLGELPSDENVLGCCLQMVANGLGVALMPMVEAHLPLPDPVRAISLGEHTFYREIGILQRAPKVSQPVVNQLAQCLRDAAEVGLQLPGS